MNNFGFNGNNIALEQEETLADRLYNEIWVIYRNKLDKYIIYIRTRWCITIFMLLFYFYRIIKYGGFYVVSYILGLYILHLSVQFFTPLGLPDIDEEGDEGHIVGDLPTTSNDNPEDFKPMIRNVPEFKYWQNITIAVFIGVFCTSSDIFDLPVFWPFLLLYFIALLVVTIKRLFKHMSKYKYGFFFENQKKVYK